MTDLRLYSRGKRGMATRVSADVEDTVRRLEGLARNAEDSEGFFKAVGDILMSRSRRRWNTEPGWAPLEWSTVKAKARSKDPRVKANAHHTLRATGALMRALTVWGAPGQKWEVRPDSATFGFYVGGEKSHGVRAADVWYGAIAQKGAGWSPKREVLKMTGATRRDIADALREHLFGGIST